MLIILSISNAISIEDCFHFASNISHNRPNLVDLVFTPKSSENHSTNFLLAKNTYTLIFGNFEGTVMTKESEKIEIKNSFGFVKKNLLRS